jgi:hypothetical protein
MKMFFACGRGDLKMLEESQADCVLESFFYKKGEAPPKWPAYYFLDSGGFTARQQNAFVDVEKYAQYINIHDIKYCFNLDTNNVPETLANQRYLEASVSAVVIPIYHYSDYMSKKYRGILTEMVEKSELIGLGGVANSGVGKPNIRKMYDYVFNKTQDKVKVHGLGITAQDILMEYPLYSVDSSTWAYGSRMGQMMRFREGKSKYSHNKTTRNTLKNRGKTSTMFDAYNLVAAAPHRNKLNISETMKMVGYLTDLWTARGVVWDD